MAKIAKLYNLKPPCLTIDTGKVRRGVFYLVSPIRVPILLTLSTSTLTSRILNIDLVEFTISIFVETSNSLLKLALSRFYCEFLSSYNSNYRNLKSRDLPLAGAGFKTLSTVPAPGLAAPNGLFPFLTPQAVRSRPTARTARFHLGTTRLSIYSRSNQGFL